MPTAAAGETDDSRESVLGVLLAVILTAGEPRGALLRISRPQTR